jgi:hypothetical protein
MACQVAANQLLQVLRLEGSSLEDPYRLVQQVQRRLVQCLAVRLLGLALPIPRVRVNPNPNPNSAWLSASLAWPCPSPGLGSTLIQTLIQPQVDALCTMDGYTVYGGHTDPCMP